MFQLIVTVIAVALVAAIAVAAVFYGGTAFTSGANRAALAALAQAGQQISAAFRLYEAEHGGDVSAVLGDLSNPAHVLYTPVQYLVAPPAAPKGLPVTSPSLWYIGRSASGSYHAYIRVGDRGDQVADPDGTIPLCREAEQRNGGTQHDHPAIAVDATMSAIALGNTPFDCVPITGFGVAFAVRL